MYLVDNPGAGDDNKQAERAASVAMASSSVYVPCMSYDHSSGSYAKDFITTFSTKNKGLTVFL